jgi:hypothetical protein
MMVVLLPASETEPSLRPAAVAKLAHLGITSVSMLRDDRTLGLVVEGWAFDPDRSAAAVVEVVAGQSARIRTLHPLLELAVSAAGGGEKR